MTAVFRGKLGQTQTLPDGVPVLQRWSVVRACSLQHKYRRHVLVSRQSPPRPHRLVRAAREADLSAIPLDQESLPQQKTEARRRWLGLPKLHTKYDREVFSIAVPALASLVLDPVMNMVDSGKSSSG